MRLLLPALAATTALVVCTGHAARVTGRSPTTEVVVTLTSPPLAYASTSETAARLAAEQHRFTDALVRRVPTATIRWRYRAVANGFAVVAPRAAVDVLRTLPGVRAISQDT